LAARLKDAGHDVVTVKAGAGFQQLDDHTFVIEPSNPRHHEELIHVLRERASLPDRIVHAWSLTEHDATQSSADGFRRAQESGFYSLLFLARALASHNAGHQIELVVLSNHTQEVLGTEILCPEKSTVQGLCLVIGQEYPNVRLKHIDLDFPHHTGDVHWSADSVLGEFLDPDSSLFVAFRNRHRWVQTFEPIRFRDPVEPRPVFRQGGVYLITGGLGKVGIAISEYLASKYRARLVLVGRAPVPERASWKAWLNGGDGDQSVRMRIRALERIEQLGGEVLYVDANVADEGVMRLAVERIYERFGVLHGVIHGAGTVGDKGYREIKDCTCESCDRHFQAKAHGLLVMEKVLDGKPLDFCLLLSSLASVLGGLGQAAYSSSNIYMDTLARKHNRSSSVPWLSVNWDVWRVQDHAAIDSGLGTTLKDLGMTAEEATAVMETLLAMKSTSQIVVSTGSLGARINQWIRLEPLQGRVPAASAAPIPSAHSERDEVEQLVAQIWQETLGIQEVGIHDNFGQLGGHSLLAIRIVAELRNAFQIDLAVRSLFDAPTVAQLSRYIKDQIIAEVGALTEEAAQRLLSEAP
jgi:acyl carrier protein/nucleoside-diphosphate-sugar epimerase